MAKPLPKLPEPKTCVSRRPVYPERGNSVPHEGLHARIERGPTNSMDGVGAGQAWHWAVYLGDDFIAFTNVWYADSATAAQACRAVVRPEIPIYQAGRRLSL